MTTSPQISITFDGLDAGQQQAVTRFMQAAAQAFEDKNPHALAAMQHAGASESGQRNTFDYNQGLMEAATASSRGRPARTRNRAGRS